MFSLKLDKINFEEELGRGVSGCIYPYQKTPGEKKWVVKYTRATNVNELLKVLPEIALGFACNHPSILPIHGYFIEKSQPAGFDIYFKLPRMEKSLKDSIKQKKRAKNPFSEETIVKYFYTIACGIEYMHRKKIVHQDIKPSNILLDQNDKVHISDVGIAKFVADDENSFIVTEMEGTYQYSAPEILRKSKDLKKRALYKADVWSLGMTISELCLLELRWFNFISTPSADPEIEIQSLIKKIEEMYSQRLASIVNRMLIINPEIRSNIEDIRLLLEQEYKQILDKQEFNVLKPPQNFQEVISLEEFKEHFFSQEKKYQEKIKELSETLTSFEKRFIDFQAKTESEISEIKMKLTLDLSNLQKKQEEDKRNLEETHSQEIMQLKDFLKQLKSKNKFLEESVLLKERINPKNQEFEEVDLDQDIKKYEKEQKKKKEKLQRLEKKIIELDTKWRYQLQIPLEQAKNTLTLNWDDYFEILLNENFVISCKAPEANIFGLLTTEITDEILDDFASDIAREFREQNLEYLEKIEIDLDSCDKITNKGLSTFFNQIADSLPNLTHLTLNLNKCLKITDDGINQMANRILGLVNLQRLSINLSNCNSITNKGANILTKDLHRYFPHIEQLFLDFFSCDNISNACMKEVFNNIHLIKSLNHLSLDFSCCNQLTDYSIKNLPFTLNKSFRNLNHMTLNFANCVQITNKGFEDFINYITNHLSNLQHLSLNFTKCLLISDESAIQLGDKLSAKLKNLNHLSLRFLQTGVSESLKKKLKQQFSYVPNLKIL